MSKFIRVVCFFLLPLFATSQTVDFSFTSTSGLFCNPATIQFTQSITGSPTGFLWNLGNGLTTTKANPVTSYIIAGSYTVKLVATFPTGPVEISKTIVISPTISPNINFDRDYICQPGVINFTAASNGNISNYDWDFGDSTGIVSTPDVTTNHTFASFDSFQVILKAVDAGGCFGQDTVQINVKKIPVTLTASPLSGCIPAPATFTADVTLPVNDAINSYAWNFGDATPPVTTTSGAASHSFTKVGSFLPILTVTTNEGCVNAVYLPRMAYGTPPINNIAYPKKVKICGSEIADLVSKATNANNYIWDFNDGETAKVIDTVAHHKFATLGLKNVKVTPYFNGCAGTASTFQIEVVGVIVKTNYIVSDCADKKTIQFLNYSVGKPTSILWDFRDNSPTSDIGNPIHTFPAAGNFITTFTLKDSVSGCLDTTSMQIFTADPVVVNPDVSICKNTSTTFTITNNYDNPASRYIWNVMGKIVNTNANPTVTVNAGVLGNSSNFVEINNGSHYCKDTVYLTHPILVRGPELDYTLPANICFADLATVTNNSKPFVAGDSVTLWYWDYRNSFSFDTIYQPQPIQFNSPGTFKVKLTGIDINGCKDSLIKIISVNPLPFLHVSPAIDTLCSGKADSLFAVHSDNILWTPAAGLSCTDCDSVLAKPTVTTKYFASAITSFNCTIRDSILVNVIPAFTAVPALPNQYVCQKEQITLDMEPKNKVIVWSPATNLSNVNIYNPIAKPTQTTTYTAQLTDSTGCFTSTASITVFIKSNPTVNAGPDQVIPYNSAFTITPTYSSNVRSYFWSPSTALGCTDCPSPSGIAATTKIYSIKVTSDSGCVATDYVSIIIECKESNIFIPTAFTPNDDNLNDYFYPITRGIKTIQKFVIYNRAGQIMYEGRNLTPNIKTSGWDGRYQGKRQNSTGYVYILEALCEQGEKITKKGTVTLLR